MNYVYVDRNCRLMAFTKSGRFLSFNSESDFGSLVLYAEMDNKANAQIFDLIEEAFSDVGLSVIN